jgi:hypothetical protein
MIQIGKAKAESAQDNLASFRISSRHGRQDSRSQSCTEGGEYLPALVHPIRGTEKAMLIALAIVLFIAWIFGFVVYHAASFAIHLLLLAAIVSFSVHLVRGRSVGV